MADYINANRIEAFWIPLWIAELGSDRRSFDVALFLILRLAVRRQPGGTDDAPQVESILGESASLVEADAVQAARDIDGALRQDIKMNIIMLWQFIHA